MLTRIQITNLGAFTSLDLNLPAVALITGGNGQGKTTLLDCIKFVGDRGHDPDIIHGNAESGEVILTLDTGDQIRARASRKETGRYWKPKDGKRWIESRELIDRIYKAIAYDPIRFLELPAKQQAEKLLELAQITVSQEDITDAVGDAALEVDGAALRSGMNGIEVINAIHKSIYDARTGLNRDTERMAAHAAELESSLRAALPDDRDWAAEAARLRSDRERLAAAEQSAIAEIGESFQAAKDGQQKRCQEECGAIDAEVNAKIAALERDRAARKDAASKKCADLTEAARGIANTKAGEVRAANRPEMDRITGGLAAAQAYDQTQQQITGTHKAIEVAKQEAAVKAERSKALSEALERLATLKASLLAKFRIGGGYVEGGKIVREQDGGLVPLKKWNTADQYKLCLAVGMKIGAGFVCIDHVEAFERKNREALIATANKYATEKGVQFIMAAVDYEGAPLTVSEPVSQ